MATADGQISFNAAVHNLMTLINNNVTKGKTLSSHSRPIFNQSWFSFTETEMDGISMMTELVGSMQTQGESTSR